MLITIDCREKKLIKECETILNYREDFSNINIEVKNLPIGDMIITDENGNEKIIVERKTMNDLASSIIDGRYKEQSHRLTNCDLQNHNIHYLIEGTYMSLGSRYNKSTIISATTSLSYFKGFSVTRTLNIKETAEWLILFANKLQKEDKKPYYSMCVNNNNKTNNQDSSNVQQKNNDTTPSVDYSEVCKRVKKENITFDNIGIIMLMQIPSVSQQIAAVVINKFKSIGNVIKALEKDANALKDFCITTKNGSKRKISKTSRDNMYKYLITMKDETIVVDTTN